MDPHPLLAVVAHNVIQLAIDTWVLHRIRRGRELSLAIGLAAGVVSALFTATLHIKPGFGAMQHLCWTLFLHGPVVLFAAAALTRRRLPAALGLAVAGVGVWSFGVEPRWLDTTFTRIETDKLTAPLRVVVLSDIQTDRVGAWERDVLTKAMALEPDVVLLPGDYVQLQDEDSRRAERARLRNLMLEVGLSAPLGLHAVQGNVDPDRTWPELFVGLDAETYHQTHTVQRGPLSITGLAFATSADGRARVPAAPGYHIVVGHYPDYSMGRIDADLMVAGHTHGGQVVLPFFGPPLTLSGVPRSQASGHTVLSSGRHLVVSRGIGMERREAPRLRFLCRPELVVIDLVPVGG